MKYIIAILQPDRLDEVLQLLTEKEIHLVTVSNVLGRGRQKGVPLKWGSKEYRLEFLPKLKVEVVVMDEDVSGAINAIIKGARTGDIGDGKIFIIPIEDAVRIRTGDSGNNAV